MRGGCGHDISHVFSGDSCCLYCTDILYQFGCQSLEASDVQVNLYAKYSFKLSNYDIEMHEEIHQTSEIFVQSTRIVLEKEKCLSLSIGVKKIFTI